MVVAASGCAHVDANYPAHRAASGPPALPEKYVYEGYYTNQTFTQLVWRQEGEIHGFLLRWEDVGAHVLRLKRLADGRNREAAKDVKRFERMRDRGHRYLALRVFAAPDVEMLIRRGDLRINFEDGTSAVAQDYYLYPVENRPDPFQSTAIGAVLISGEADPYMQGRRFFIFVSEQWEDKKVESVEVVGT
jgi:hypothetical protein